TRRDANLLPFLSTTNRLPRAPWEQPAKAWAGAVFVAEQSRDAIAGQAFSHGPQGRLSEAMPVGTPSWVSSEPEFSAPDHVMPFAVQRLRESTRLLSQRHRARLVS